MVSPVFDKAKLKSTFDRRAWLLVMALTALAFGLRLVNLGYSDLTFDETASYFVARQPLAQMIPYLLHAFHEHPPAYFVLLSGWMQMLGHSESMLRMLSVLLGTLSIPLMYQFARQAVDTRAGLVAALLLSTMPVHIFYSQTARMYALLGDLALLSWWLILRLQDIDRTRTWVALATCSLIGLATHYYMGLVIASQAVYLLTRWRRNKRLFLEWLFWLGIPLALAILYVAAAPGAMGTIRSMFKGGLGSRLTMGGLRGLAAELIVGPHGNTLGIAAWSIVLAMVLLGIGLALSGRVGVKRSIGVLLLCAIVLPLVLSILLPEAIAARYVLFLIFPIILALTIVILSPLSLPLGNLTRRRWLWLPTVVMCGALLVLNGSRLPYHYDALDSDYGRTIDFVRANYRAGDGVVFNGPWQAVMQYYYPIGNIPAIYLPPQTPPALDPATAEPALRQFVRSYNRIWVVPLAIEQADPERFVQRWLNEHWFRTSDREQAILYYAPPAASMPVLFAPLRFGNAIELQAAEVATTTVEAGSAVLSTLTWRALQPNDGDIQITLDVVDQGGNVWGQRIYQPGEHFVDAAGWNGGQSVVDRQAVPLDPGMPPGPYQLRVTAQRASSGEILAVPGQPDSTGMVLADLIVSAPAQPVADQQVPGQVVNARFNDRLQLLKVQTPTAEYVQGGIVPVTLYWRALGGDREVAVDVALVDKTGQVIAQSTGPLGPEWYRASQWQPQQVVATLAPLQIPSRQQPGRYQLRVRVRDRAGQPVPAQGKLSAPGPLGLWQTDVPQSLADWPVGELEVVARQRNFSMPAMQQAANITFGDQIQLLGYDLDTAQARPGSQLRVTFYWKALQPIDQNYVVFTHLLDSAGQQQGQRDSMPVGGLNPTPFWQQGEIVADTYAIDIDPQAPAGEYTLDFGWYQSDTAERLPAVDAGGVRLRDDIAQISGIPVLP